MNFYGASFSQCRIVVFGNRSNFSYAVGLQRGSVFSAIARIVSAVRLQRGIIFSVISRFVLAQFGFSVGSIFQLFLELFWRKFLSEWDRFFR